MTVTTTGAPAAAGPGRERPPAAEAGGPTLGRLLVEIGRGAWEVLCASPGGLAEVVRAVRIVDGESVDGAVATGDLVLAVGVAPTSPVLSRLLAHGARAGVAAVAIRGAVNLSWVRTEAQRLGVTVLVVSRELSWDRVHARVRAALTSPGPAAASRDLRAVANTAAAALGGPVEIDDAGMRVLAVSDRSGRSDGLRTVPIRSRPAPEDSTTWLRESGLLARLPRARGPLRIDPPGDRPRLVVPVRAGARVLGYVWLTEGDEPLDDRHERVLAEVAGVVSAHLGQAGHAERPGLPALLARALDGDADALAAHLRLPPDAAVALVGFRPRLPWTDPDVDPVYLRDQLELRREGPGGVRAAAAVGGHVYAVVAGAAEQDPDLTATAREVVAAVGGELGQELVAVTAPAGMPLDCLADARRSLDRALRLLAEDPRRTVASADELRPHLALALVRELARDRPELLAGPVAELAAIDRARRTDYLATLRAYFDTASDLSEAARVLYVHRNTLRYRLRRIQELCGLDLTDPVARLVAELQLRLLDDALPAGGRDRVEERASS